MNIYLGEHFETMIREQVASGRYANASEVVREALRRYEDYETRLAKLRAEIQLGLDDIEVGRVIRVEDNHAFFEEIRREARERIEAMRAAESIRAAS